LQQALGILARVPAYKHCRAAAERPSASETIGLRDAHRGPVDPAVTQDGPESRGRNDGDDADDRHHHQELRQGEAAHRGTARGKLRGEAAPWQMPDARGAHEQGDTVHRRLAKSKPHAPARSPAARCDPGRPLTLALEISEFSPCPTIAVATNDCGAM